MRQDFMYHLIAGQRITLADCFQQVNLHQIYIGLSIQSQQSINFDMACFGVDENDQLIDDRYFIFYNQQNAPNHVIAMTGSRFPQDQEGFMIQLDQLPSFIQKLVFTITIDGDYKMSQIEKGHLRLCYPDGQTAALFEFHYTDFNAEKAIIVGEIYYKNMWRFSAVGQGFNGGLKALLQAFGGEEEQSAPSSPKKIQLEKEINQHAPHLLSLFKTMHLALEKNHLEQIQAQVILVLDASGSMSRQYKDGRVQMVIDRISTLALQFDTHHSLDVWAYADACIQLEPVKLSNMTNYLNRQVKLQQIQGGRNNEIPILYQIIEQYQKATVPVYVVFISDGGVLQSNKIKKILTEASRYPIFWQFVGLGGANYGIFEHLDTMGGRLVDNCSFFTIDDIRRISDQILYDRLLKEFPKWIQAAKQHRILS